MSSTMTATQIPASRKATKVDSRSTVSPPAFWMLKLVKVGKFFRALAPLVTGPSLSHWKMARMISPKPSVAIAR